MPVKTAQTLQRDYATIFAPALLNKEQEKSGISGPSLVNLSHQQIADTMVTNRVVISRIFKKLENENRLLVFRNQIKLLKD